MKLPSIRELVEMPEAEFETYINSVPTPEDVKANLSGFRKVCQGLREMNDGEALYQQFISNAEQLKMEPQGWLPYLKKKLLGA